jgi:glycosyltransferase involved in cell wall biosynthesis
MTGKSHTGPIRVLFVDHTAKIGGGEIALLNLVRNLDRTLIEPIVLLYSDGPLVARLKLYAETCVLPICESVGAAKKDMLGWRSLLHCKEAILTLRHIWKVARFARRMQVDLVHTNSLKADIIGGLAARLAGVPVVWHVRDRIEEDYLPPAVVRLFRLLASVVPNFIIANSWSTLATLHLKAGSAGVAISSGVVMADRSSVVHDGCEMGDTPRNGQSDELIRIGLIGRISPWKGQHIFLQAAARLREQHPKARFEIIGAPLFSEHEYEAELHRLVRILGIEDIVEFSGFVEDIAARIELLDIVVHASTIPEPFGQVIIEAMASGRPVVATNGGGASEIVNDGVTGTLVPMGDPVKMAEAVAWLIGNPERAVEMGLRGRQRVLEQFTIQKTARMVEAVYQEMLNPAQRLGGVMPIGVGAR